MSFFFVLSGFILTRVYPSLPDRQAVFRFFVARFARLFPTHLLCLLLMIPLVGVEFTTKNWISLATAVTLLQSWVPDIKPLMFNYPAWSISTEAFFYASFPLLLIAARRRPILVFCLSLLPAAAAIFAFMPDLNHLITPEGAPACKATLVLTMNPLVRLSEFVGGILVALLTEKNSRLETISNYRRTLTMACAVMIPAAFSANFYLAPLNQGFLSPLIYWMHQTGCILPYALLIAVASLRSGLLQRMLSNRFLVHLGNLSFAMYMVHAPLINTFLTYATELHMPIWLSYPLFWLTLLAASEAIYSLYEKPVREWMVARFNKSKAPQESRFFKRQMMSACTAVCVVGGLVSIHQLRSVWKIHDIQEQSPYSICGAQFGNRFKLLGMHIVKAADPGQLRVELAWQHLQPSSEHFVTAVHLIDKSGQIRTTLDYAHDPSKAGNNSWYDEVALTAAQLEGISAVGIGVFPANKCEQLLTIDRGPRDWNNRRLNIPIQAILVE